LRDLREDAVAEIEAAERLYEECRHDRAEGEQGEEKAD